MTSSTSKTNSSPKPTQTSSKDDNGSQPSSDKSSGKSLSGGAVAGIVIGLLAVIGALVGYLFWRRHKQRQTFVANSVDYNEFPEYDPNGLSHPNLTHSTAALNNSEKMHGAAAGSVGHSVFDINPSHHHNNINARDLDEA
ncbi:hypothetical protein FBU31_001670 [Coemansia sp. 'formosensis']|nr:hypothetical protein FBU31_001670 [Coemansia sp. 'formosensis']